MADQVPVPTPPSQPDKTGGGVFHKVLAIVNALLPSAPAWSKTLVTVLVVALLAYLHKQFPASPPVQVSVVGQVEPSVSYGSGSEVGADTEKRRDARKLFAKVVRRKLADQLQKDGYAMVGGDPKPLDHIQAWSAVNKLDDNTIATAAVESGVVTEGRLLDSLGRIMDWLVAHQDQIMRLVEFLMKLLLLLG